MFLIHFFWHIRKNGKSETELLHFQWKYNSQHAITTKNNFKTKIHSIKLLLQLFKGFKDF